MSTPTPSGDVSVTAPGCPACGQPLPAGRPRRFCSPACRQAAYRRRHQRVAPVAVLPPRRSRLQGTLYQCPECDTRYLAEQWCPDCSRPCRRLGAGGIRPSCEEMITVEELTTDAAASSPLPFTNRPIHHWALRSLPWVRCGLDSPVGGRIGPCATPSCTAICWDW